MALTPEDVINKRFQPTKFREGYDQDEVDDFLDEVVVELRRLNQEHEDLRKQLETSGTPVPSAAADDSPAGSAAVTEEERDTATAPARTAPAPDTETSPDVSAAPAQPDAAGTDETASSAAGVLAMAQKLHDEYVGQGRAERERLITEGRSQADQLVSEGRRTREDTLSALETEKARLEATVEQLRAFEGDYRTNLKDFISGQLREIDATGSLVPAETTANTTGGGAQRGPATGAK